MSISPQAITEAELAEALRVLNVKPLSTRMYMPTDDPETGARVLFDLARSGREPEYEPGEIYEDASGGKWCRERTSTINPDAHPGWRFCESGTSNHHDVPDRPLRKLVPEAPRPDHAVILAEIRGWASHGCGLENLADRLVKLLEGTP